MKSLTVSGNVIKSTEGILVADLTPSIIYSTLIKEVGMHVNYYQADILYEIKKIDEAIKQLKNEEFRIGLRDNGVDSESQISIKESDIEMYGHPYKLIIKIKTFYDIENKEYNIFMEEDTTCPALKKKAKHNANYANYPDYGIEDECPF